MKNNILKLLAISFIFLTIVGCNKKEKEINENTIKGKWIATTENQNQYIKKGKEKYGGKNDYYLECTNNSFTLKIDDNNTIKGTYTISDSNQITFIDEEEYTLAICDLINNEIDCSKKSTYAFKY